MIEKYALLWKKTKTMASMKEELHISMNVVIVNVILSTKQAPEIMNSNEKCQLSEGFGDYLERISVSRNII